MTTSLYEALGGLDLPIDPAGISTTLAPLDPARTVLAGLFKAAINAELGPAWTKATAGLSHKHLLFGSLPLADVLELEPSVPVMQDRKPAWPLLCVHRTGTATHEEHTLGGQIQRITQQWGVHYILGPLDVGELRKLSDACIAVAKIVNLCIRRRGHPAYQGGALQFFQGHGRIGAIRIVSHDGPGQASFASDPKGVQYYATTLVLETVEYSYNVDGADGDFEGLDLTIDAGSDDGVLPGLIYGASDVPYQYP
jgi:hypothetical protein